MGKESKDNRKEHEPGRRKCIQLLWKMKVDIFNTDKKYNIIYADPPWSYQDKALAGSRGAVCKYPVMNIKDICDLPVEQLADNDCVLFMWVTMPKLNECFEVIEKWGFKYKTNAFTWIKQNKKSDSLFWGMGRWTRSNAELCLLATKGNPQRVNAGVHSVIVSHIEEHSKKPAETRNRIVSLMGGGAKNRTFCKAISPRLGLLGIGGTE